jgi:hypothetical protein
LLETTTGFYILQFGPSANGYCLPITTAISDDGKYMAFQLAINGEATGMGHGIMVYDFAATKKYFAEKKILAH